MASNKSTEPSATEIELKRRGRRRLIGAATIGLLAVVFLPMIFDGESKRNLPGSTLRKQEISVQVPPKEGQPALPTPSATPVAPAPVAAAPAATAIVTAPPVSTPEAGKAVADVAKATVPEPAVVAKPTVAAVTTKNEKPEPAASKPATVATETAKKGFVVQLGVFADADNAKQTIAKMKETKLPVYSESIPIKSGTATRVRIGPFATHDKADAALVQIKLAGSDGKIVPLQ